MSQYAALAFLSGCLLLAGCCKAPKVLNGCSCEDLPVEPVIWEKVSSLSGPTNEILVLYRWIGPTGYAFAYAGTDNRGVFSWNGNTFQNVSLPASAAGTGKVISLANPNPTLVIAGTQQGELYFGGGGSWTKVVDSAMSGPDPVRDLFATTTDLYVAKGKNICHSTLPLAIIGGWACSIVSPGDDVIAVVHANILSSAVVLASTGQDVFLTVDTGTPSWASFNQASTSSNWSSDEKTKFMLSDPSNPSSTLYALGRSDLYELQGNSWKGICCINGTTQIASPIPHYAAVTYRGGDLMLGSAPEGVLFRLGGQWQVYNGGLPQNKNIRTVVSMPNGKFLAGTPEGPYRTK